MLRLRHAIVLLALVGGCGPGASSVDAGEDAEIVVDASTTQVAQPQIPWLAAGAPPVASPAPVRFTCPPGWVATELETDISVCEPLPGETPDDCAPSEMIAPGETACSLVGSTCPVSGWPVVATGATSLYVRAGAASGDGSIAAPLGDIDSAVAMAAPGSWIVLAPGRYESTGIARTSSLTIVGACASETTIAAAAGGDAAIPLIAVDGDGAGLTLRDVTLEPAGHVGVDLTHGSSLVGEDLIVRGAGGDGIAAQDMGTAMTLHSVRVSGSVRGTHNGGIGVRADHGATLTGRRLLLDSNHGGDLASTAQGAGTMPNLPTSVDVEDMIAWGLSADTSAGAGVNVRVGTLLRLRRVLVEGAHALGFALNGGEADAQDIVARRLHGSGITTAGARTTLARVWIEDVVWNAFIAMSTNGLAEDVVVRHVTPNVIDGLEVGGTTLRFSGTMRRVAIADTVSVGIQLAADATLEDARVRDVRRPMGSLDPVAAVTTTQDNVHVSRLLVEQAVDFGFAIVGNDIAAGGPSVHAAVEDLTVRDADAAVIVQGLAELVADRVVISGSDHAALYAGGGALTVTDARVDGALNGVGAVTRDGAHLTLERSWFRMQTLGALAGSGVGATLDATDVVVTALVGDAMGSFGRGIEVDASARATLTRVRIDGAREVALLALTNGTVNGTDVTVVGTQPRACASAGGPPECVATAGGTAVGSYSRGSVSLTRFELGGAPLCGLQIADNALLDISSGRVHDCGIGVCVQVDVFDLARSAHDVVFASNGHNLETTTIPVPAAPPLPMIMN